MRYPSIADFDFTQIPETELERIARGYHARIDEMRVRFAAEHGISVFETDVSIVPDKDNAMLLHVNIRQRSI